MITLNLNIDSKNKEVVINDDILFNTILVEHPKAIRRIIKDIYPLFPISESFFTIVNGYVDVDSEGNYPYPGLIVRTGIDSYAVLCLEDTEIDEEYMMALINEYIHDVDDITLDEININHFKVEKKSFLNALKHI